MNLPGYNRIASAVDDDGQFQIGCRRHVKGIRFVQGLGKGQTFRLITKDRDQRRRVDDHSGNPVPLSKSRSPIVSDGGRSLSNGAVRSESLSSHSSRPSRFAAFSWRSSRSLSAFTTAIVTVSPFRCASCRASRCASSFLMFRAIVFHLSTIKFYHSTITGIIAWQEAPTSGHQPGQSQEQGIETVIWIRTTPTGRGI